MVTSFFQSKVVFKVRPDGDPKSASPVVRKARISSAFD
jgi:hypothetical protein